MAKGVEQSDDAVLTKLRGFLATMFVAALSMPAMQLQATTPREILADAAFKAADLGSALKLIMEADRAAALLARDPGNRDAALIRAMALGYRAKLTRSRADALAARKQFEGFAAANPRDAEAVASVGTWHLDSVIDLGGLVAGMAIGAKKATGLAMMDRAVLLGGNRAMYSGLAALLRLAIDPADPVGRSLAEKASVAATPFALDQILKRHATAVLVPLRAGDPKAAQRLARQLLPFGRVPR